MKISTEKPPIWDEVAKVFPVKWEDGVIVTYGDTVYCKYPFSPLKMIHESVHIDQQAYAGKDNWWARYFSDEPFRLEQELEAYKAEVKEIKALIKDRNHRDKRIRTICNELSSPMYGNLITFSEAMSILNK
jgi:hypothetical protein